MTNLYMWWHQAILAHRISGPRLSLDAKGAFDVYECNCGKAWAK